ncbi:YrhK family protein [Demequina sp. NBRC 110055]|uniref:YrhK family protein n=1 Tax=Demequina sp. NBRC 110055 TaxID=1570344 RepID=UPI0009FBF8E4|nr:YrhK family protein [Demequina sp. NBRC 110055]
MTSRDAHDDLTFTVGHEEIDIRHRWETASIVNDVLVGLWFLAGSIMFLFENLMTVGTWFFIIGSAELLARPLIKLGRNIHVGRVRRQGA